MLILVCNSIRYWTLWLHASVKTTPDWWWKFTKIYHSESVYQYFYKLYVNYRYMSFNY